MRGLYRARKIIRRIRRRLIPGALILMYHRIADLPDDPYELAVSPRNFTRHLEYILESCTVMRLVDLAKTIHSGEIPPRSVAFTFDDGFADNQECALPILEDAKIPATVFVATGQIGSDREFWWDELERVFLTTEALPSQLSIMVGAQEYGWTIDSKEKGQAIRAQLHRLIKPLQSTTRDQIVEQLVDWAGLSRNCRAYNRALRASELVSLAGSGLIEIGAHTITHPSLAFLSEEEQGEEIIGSRMALETLIGEPVTSFAYPYGKQEDFTDRTATLVREAGFLQACTTVCASLEAGRDLFQLNRCGIHNWSIDVFVQNLKDFFIS